jgi:hypothetical protein
MKPNETDFITREETEADLAVQPGVPEGFRRLRWDEPVREGDFVVDEQRGFEPWEGPSGFRADMFVKPIYRREKMRAAKEAEKSE